MNLFELYEKEKKKIISISILLLVPAQEIGFSSISICPIRYQFFRIFHPEIIFPRSFLSKD